MKILLLGSTALAAICLIAGLLSYSNGRGEAFPGASGKIAFTRQLEFDQGWGEIFAMNPDGSDQVNLTNAPGYDEEPAWSPDGSMIAFHKRSDGAPGDIWVMNADGTGQRNITNTPLVHDVQARWSPDGATLVFASDAHIAVIGLDSSRMTILTDGYWDEEPAWSPDGGRIAFQRILEGGLDIFVMNADGSDPTNITTSPGNEYGAAWSPDGTRIAFSNQSSNVFVMNSCGRDITPLTRDGRSTTPAWSPDGTKLVFDHWPPNGNTQIWIMDLDGGNPHEIAMTEAVQGQPDWQPVVLGSPAPPSPVRVDCPAPSPTPSPTPSPAPSPAPSPTPVGLPKTGGRP